MIFRKGLSIVYILLMGSLTGLSAQAIVLDNPSRCNLELDIEDNQCPDGSPFNNPNQFIIDVQGESGTALGLDVYLKEVRLLISHQWIGDIEVSLTSPGGEQVLITDDNGGNSNNYGNPSANCSRAVRFTEDACVSIADEEQAVPPFIDQPYRPMESLLDFNDGLTDPNGAWILSICDDLEQDTGRLQFVELVFAPLTCLPITDVQVLEQDSTSLLLNWGPAGDCSQVSTYLEYGPPGFTPGSGASAGPTGTLIPVACPPFLLTGLAPDTEYDLYFRKQCQENEFSGNTCGLRIQTGCLPARPTTTETFNQDTLCSTRCERSCALSGIFFNPENDPLDWIVYSGPTPTQGTGPPNDVDGDGNYIYLEASGSACPAGSTAELRSDCFELQKRGTGDCHFSFYYYMDGFNVADLHVEISVDGGITWQRRWSRSGRQGRRWNKAYLGLGDYPDGSIIQMRFVGSKGSGPQGDIALDNISFHGSVHLGRPENTFYADQDGDGFGDPGQFINTCLNNPPAGYVVTSGDCNDQNPAVNPDAEEIPCDNIDNNCNGITDDFDLPPPQVVHDTICSGETPLLEGIPVSGKFIFWFTSPTAEDEIPAFGNFYSPDIPPNQTGEVQIYRFYAEETDLICRSVSRTEAIVVVNPRPQADPPQTAQICLGDSLDLSRQGIVDLNQTGAEIRFFDELPLTPENELNAPLVLPAEQSSTYYFQMRSPLGCTTAGTIPVQALPPPEIDFSLPEELVLCIGSTRQLSALVSNQQGPLQYAWNTGADSSEIQIEAGPDAGIRQTYAVTVSNSFGCRASDSLQVRTISSIDSIARSIQDVSTCSGSDGAIQLEPLDGSPPFRYLWAGTDGSQGDSLVQNSGPFVLDGLTQGSYRVTISDASSDACTFRMPPAYINGPDAEIRRVEVQPVNCQGSHSGRIELMVTGSPQFQWSTGDTTRILDQVGAGYYSVTVTEGNCTTVLDSILVDEPTPLKLRFSAIQPACAELANGRITAEAFGGTGPYQFEWDHGPNTPQANNLSTGRYFLTLRDAQGCSLRDSFQLQAPAPLQVGIDSLLSVSCAGTADALLQVRASGGTGPYLYTWEDQSIGPERQGLGPGRYEVRIQDQNGCRVNRDFNFTEPAPVQIQLAEQQAPSCLGDTSGYIEVAATGGNGNYSFTWLNGGAGSRLENLGVGTYRVFARDENNCLSDTLQTQLDAVSRVSLTPALTLPTCAGRMDGQITIQTSGVAPFSYQWSTGDSTATLNGLDTGRYAVTVTDSEGCQGDTSLVMGYAGQPISADFNLIQPRCANSDDGLINLNIGNSPNRPLSYRWNDGPLVRDRQNVEPGAYQVTITDNIGCTLISDTLNIFSPDPLEIELISQGPIQCQNDRNGFLEVDVRGGIGPYEYTWIGSNATGSLASNLGAGSYQLFVEDANGCPANTSFVLNEPPPLAATLDLQSGDICAGDTSNVLRLDVAGGVPPYNYAWSNGVNTAVQENLPPGDYSAVITDANQCREVLPPIKVRETKTPLDIVSFTTEPISCAGRRDGKVNVQIRGGLAPFTYIFSNASIIETSDTIVSIENLSADNDYRVTVADARGCIVQSNILPITDPAPLAVRRDSIVNIRCAGEADGEIYITPSGGTPPYAYSWINAAGREVSSLQDLRFAPEGTYLAIIGDARGCLDTLWPNVILDNRTPLLAADTLIRDQSCSDLSDGSIRPMVTGGTGSYTFIWSNGRRTPQIDRVAPGLYSLTVTDELACRLVLDSLEVDPARSTLTVNAEITSPSCAETTDGEIRLEVSGGILPYQLEWEKDGIPLTEDTSFLTGLDGGLYSLLARDSAGCQKSFTFPVTAPPPLQANFITQNPGDSLELGRIELRVSGGTPPYLYLWNTGDTVAILDSLPAGSYSVDIQDSLGCRLTRVISLINTGILDAQLIEQIRLFPNPASGEVNIELRLNRPVGLIAELYSAQARLEKRWADLSPVNGAQGEWSLVLPDLANGLYFLSLRDKDTGRPVYTAPILIKQQK